MPRNKHFNVHILKFIYSFDGNDEAIKPDELKRIIAGIKSLPIDISSEKSRYSAPGSSNEHCLIFIDETTLPYSTDDYIIPAIFIHRRGKNRPFEEDGKGHLIELKLNNNNNELAEIASIVFNLKSGYCFWIYNPFVGGINQFTDYINSKITQLAKMGFEQHTMYGGIPFLIYPI
jgi:hypothetical protein